MALLSLLVNFVLTLRVRTMGRRASASGRPQVTSIGDDRVEAVQAHLATLARRLEADEARAQRAIQRVGVVRFNPFADTGSNQSFVLALLDASGDGFVLSSLHSRQQTRVFLKQVKAGRADAAVSEEEAEAIRRAIGS